MFTKNSYGTSPVDSCLCINTNAGRRRLAQEHSAKLADQERHIASFQAQLAAREAKYQNELLQAQQSAHSEVERVRLRADAEVADLKASMNRLEVDLIKVRQLHPTYRMDILC